MVTTVSSPQPQVALSCLEEGKSLQHCRLGSTLLGVVKGRQSGNSLLKLLSHINTSMDIHVHCTYMYVNIPVYMCICVHVHIVYLVAIIILFCVLFQ